MDDDGVILTFRGVRVSLELDLKARNQKQGIDRDIWEWKQALRLEIWQRIIDYANIDVTTGRAAAREEDEFSVLISRCITWIEPTIGSDFLKWPSLFSSAFKAADRKELSITGEADRHRKSIRQVLHWIANPADTSTEDSRCAFAFLRTNVESIRWSSTVTNDFTSTQRSTAFWYRSPLDFATLVSPICQFIWLQMERYRSGSDDLKKIIPVGVCCRPGCGQFFMITRVGTGKYHNPSCRTMHWQSTHKEAARETRLKNQREAKARAKRGLKIVMSEPRRQRKEKR
jgi:hypothetical protein